MKKKLTALVLAAVMCMSMCISAHAYATFGYCLKGTWQYDYYCVTDREDGYGDLVDAAVSAWNDAVELKGDNHPLDIELTETTKETARTTRVVIAPSDRGKTGWAGFAFYYKVSLSGTWTCLNEDEGYPEEDYQTGHAVINRYYTDGYSNTKIKNIMMHEMGHIFGLAHSSSDTDNGSLMYKGIASVSTLRKPQTDDVNGVRSIYE